MTKPLYLDVFSELSGVSGFFSTKYGASKGAPYHHEETLREAGVGDLPRIGPEQVHLNRIAIIGRTEQGTFVDRQLPPDRQAAGGYPAGGYPAADTPLWPEKTDGLITDVPGVLLTTVHADCVPVYLYDDEHRAIGLAHAGWRGTKLGIGARAAALMGETYGSSLEKLHAFIGPSIGQCCFETGWQVYEAFRQAWPFIDEFAAPAARKGKYMLDLKGINRRQLLEIGLRPERIQVSPHCTCCEPELFASYRRDGGTYLRMGAGLWLEA